MKNNPTLAGPKVYYPERKNFCKKPVPNYETEKPCQFHDGYPK